MRRRGLSTFRIALVGAESTGKTTLAEAIAERFSAPWVPEFAREYASRVGRPLAAADVEPIARGQVALEDRALALRPPLVVLDTDLVSTLVYARHYYHTYPEWITTAARTRASNLYLLLSTDLPFAADEVRDRAEARDEIQRLFRAQLQAFDAAVIEVEGAGDVRLERALRAIAGHWPEPRDDA